MATLSWASESAGSWSRRTSRGSGGFAYRPVDRNISRDELRLEEFELEASDLRHSSSCLGICLEELVVEGSEDVAKSTVSAAGIKELRPEETEAANRASTSS